MLLVDVYHLLKSKRLLENFGVTRGARSKVVTYYLGIPMPSSKARHGKITKRMII